MRDALQGPAYVSVARSGAGDCASAVAEILSSIALEETAFVLVFAPRHLGRDDLAQALTARLCGVPAFGCTTAGQITLRGYENDALLLIAFPKLWFRCASALLAPLQPLSISGIGAQVQRQMARFSHRAGWNRLALVFADGLSRQEDLLASMLEVVLEGLPVFGGSAGDGLLFESTHVLHDGAFHENAALLLWLETRLAFQELSFDHFQSSDVQVIVTRADPDNRIVFEINGAPAAQEYARLIGCVEGDLCPAVFAENPMLVHHRRTHYVRAISAATPDHALHFLAAIEEGIIMTLGRGKAVLETLHHGLDLRSDTGRPPDFILGFDCVLRKLELEHKGMADAASEMFRAARVVGFNTYGEQHRGLHMNHTFLGVAFYPPEAGGAP